MAGHLSIHRRRFQQWSSIQEQRNQLEMTEHRLMEVKDNNDRREQELETLSPYTTRSFPAATSQPW